MLDKLEQMSGVGQIVQMYESLEFQGKRIYIRGHLLATNRIPIRNVIN